MLDDPNLPEDMLKKAAMLRQERARLNKEADMGIAGALSNQWRGPKYNESMSQFQGQYQKMVQDAIRAYEARRSGVPHIPSDIDQTGQTHMVPPDKEAAAREAMITGLAPIKARGAADYAEMSKQTELNPQSQMVRGDGTVVATNSNRAGAGSSEEFRLALAKQSQDAAAERARDSQNAAAERAREAQRAREDEAARVREAAKAKPAKDHRWKNEVGGEQEPIPGTPADVKARGTFNADTATRLAGVSALDRLDKQVDLVLDSALDKITGVQGAFPNIPGSPASVSRARLDTLKFQVGFSVLQELRSTSKNNATGLGQVTEKEHQYLQAQLGNLERAQSESELRRVLKDIKEFIADSKDRIDVAYNLKHEGSSYKPSKTPRPVDTWTDKDEEEYQRLEKSVGGR